MKKYLVGLVSILLITGAGCSSALQNMLKNSSSQPVIITDKYGFSSFVDTKNFSNEQLFVDAGVNAGFHIYFPNPIPASLVIDKKFIWNKNSANIFLFKTGDDGSDGSRPIPQIIIQESLVTSRPNLVSERLEKITAKEQVYINQTPGYFGLYQPAPSTTFNTLIFSTQDGVDIGIWSRFFDKNALIILARSIISPFHEDVENISSGMCIMRDQHTSIPNPSDPDMGKGYVKVMKHNMANYQGLKTACSKEDFTSMLKLFCQSNKGGAQEEVVAIKNDGNLGANGCGQFGCDLVKCP